MINYIHTLLFQLQTVKEKLNNEKDEFKLIDLNIELVNLENKMNYCIESIFDYFSDKNIMDFARNFLSVEKINEAEKKASNANIVVLNRIIKQGYNPKESLEIELNELLKNNPNIENEEFKDTREYKRFKSIQKDIKGYTDYINNAKKKINYFYSYLNDEDKFLLVEKLLINFNNDKDKEKELLKKINDYKPYLDLLANATYPLNERYEQLTKNQDNNLTKYLIENKEAIDRLTVKSNHDTVVKYFDKKVLKTEYRITATRQENFSKYAKEAGINDITNNVGQFDNDKIYFNENNHNRYYNCISEIQTSDETKKAFKELLHKLDELNILEENAYAGESANKIYGFAKFYDAQNQFINAMNEEPANEEKIRKSLEELKKEEAKINTMYDLIKEKLGDDCYTMPSNVDSFRNSFVPPCFKNNLSLNAKFNSLFITLTFIKEKNLTIEEFVDNPVKCSSKAYEKYFQENSIDNILDGKSKAEALLYLSDTSKQPTLEDPFKYTRSFEIIVKNETNEEYQRNNHISSVALGTYNGNLNRALAIGIDYFSENKLETIQNILMAKKAKGTKISYFDCYVPSSSIHENIKTGLADDERATILEKIQTDENIEKTFYDAIATLKNFTLERKNLKKGNNINLESNDVFDAVQELAIKIILTCDLKGKSVDQKRGYSESFVEDVFNIIDDYKSFEVLKDFNFKIDNTRINKMINVIKNKDQNVKTAEKNLKEAQKTKEEAFINEFERLNKEIDVLDNQAELISKNLKKGTTNKDIEEIAIQQQRKFVEIRKLQNRRIDELKKDVSKGLITKYYFEKRVEQIKLLDNIKEQPAFFEFEEKCYKDYKTFTKEVLKINPKELSSKELKAKKDQYNIIYKQMQEEKRLFFINKVLESNGLSINKPINYKKVENIIVEENIEEMKNLSNELLVSNQKINEAKVNKEQIIVDLGEEDLIEENIISEEKEEVITKDRV